MAFVRDAMNECERRGGAVDLEFLHIETPFIINGMRIDQASLGEAEVRIMMEHLAVVTDKAKRIHVINRLGLNASLAATLKLVKKNVSPGRYPEVSRRIAGILDPYADDNEGREL